MKKRIMIAVLVLVVVFSTSACGGEPQEDSLREQFEEFKSHYDIRNTGAYISKDISVLDSAFSNFQNALADVAAMNGVTPTANGYMDDETREFFEDNVGIEEKELANKLSSKKSKKGTINFYAGSNGTDTYVCVTSNQLSVCSICGKLEDGSETHLVPNALPIPTY